MSPLDDLEQHGNMRIMRSWSRLATTAAIVIATTGFALTTSASPAAAVSDDDWLGVVNSYRQMSGLGLVTENPTWSTGAMNHSCYMLLNGISHHEVAGNPGYTPDGLEAGMNGNVAVSSAITATSRSHVELWMTGPFHAIGVLRHNLTTTGFGRCTNPDTPKWHSGATLDVLRGLNPIIPRPSTATVFPGREATVPVDRFIAETPNPVTLCGWSGDAGLPLVALMPQSVSTASSSLTGPSGPLETCTLHPGNTGSDATARGVLQSENGVVVVPRAALAPGRYTASVTSDGGSVSWSFNIDPNAPLPEPGAPPPPTGQPAAAPPPETQPTTSPIGDRTVFEPVTPYRAADSRRSIRVVRLQANTAQTVELGDAGDAAVSANFTVAGQSGPGHLSADNCSSSAPSTSTVNFAWQPSANQAVVPLSSKGSLCLVSSADAEVIIDVNGWYRDPSSTTTTFTPASPTRLYDTRSAGNVALSPGTTRQVPVRGVPGGAPADATAVALNLTAVNPSSQGWLRAFPCDAGSESEVSNVNFGPGQTRPNSAIVPVSADGTICLASDVHVDVIVDIGGHFAASGGHEFQALRPVRIVDTRSASTALNPITGGALLAPQTVHKVKIAGAYGIPSGTRGIALNVTAVSPSAPGYLAVFPCGEQPTSSNLNFHPDDLAVANGVMVGLSSGGEVCFVSDQPTHLLIDVSGAWRLPG